MKIKVYYDLFHFLAPVFTNWLWIPINELPLAAGNTLLWVCWGATAALPHNQKHYWSKLSAAGHPPPLHLHPQHVISYIHKTHLSEPKLHMLDRDEVAVFTPVIIPAPLLSLSILPLSSRWWMVMLLLSHSVDTNHLIAHSLSCVVVVFFSLALNRTTACWYFNLSCGFF